MVDTCSRGVLVAGVSDREGLLADIGFRGEVQWLMEVEGR